MDITLAMLTDQKSLVHAQAKDATGKVVPDALVWSTDNQTAVALTPSTDGSSCLITSLAPGAANVRVTDGTLTSSVAVQVSARVPNVIEIVADPASDIDILGQ